MAYGPPDASIGLDILARLGEVYTYENVEAETRKLGDLTVPVATVRMLYRMKRNTVRWKDRIDAERLRDVFGLEDV